MRGGDDTGNAPESRRLTPSIGLSYVPGADAEPLEEESHEDFLFHIYRGSELLQDDRAHEAREELERALRLQPHDTRGQDLLAVVYFRLGHYQRAITLYEQLRRRAPNDTSILLNVSLCYLKTGEAAQARRALEQLLAMDPAHTRAWGYLGLACERAGDLEAAQQAFERGGHGQMVERMAELRASHPAPASRPSAETALAERPLRDVIADAFEELAAGELSFTLAAPQTPPDDAAAQSWRAVELGQRRDTALGLQQHRPPDTITPDTRDGPPPSPEHAPELLHLPPRHPFAPPASVGRRSTLIAPVPPAPVPPQPTRKTLPPRFEVRSGTEPPPPVEKLARDSVAPFPEAGKVVLHASGLALVALGPASSFAARGESIRASSSSLAMKTLERHARGKPTGESFGGPGSPVVHATGEGQLVLGPRHGRRIISFALADEVCFVREEVVLGFDGPLVFDNGRLSSGDGDTIAIVQLRGSGAVLLETTGETLSLEVQHGRGLCARRDVVLAWFGRIVARALSAGEAPGGQHGLVSFAGEGRVLVAAR